MAPRRARAAGLAAAAALIVAIVPLTGCGAPDVPAATSAAGPSTQPSATADGTSGATAPAAPSEGAPSEGTMVPPPSGVASGDDGPLEAAPLPTATAAIDEAIELETGMVIEVLRVAPIRVVAQTPGEVDGSAVRVVVAARNGSDEPQSVDSAVVTLAAADGEHGIGTTAGGPSPLAGTVAPGEVVTGTYVFMLGDADGREVTVSVNYAAGEPVAVFTGPTS